MQDDNIQSLFGALDSAIYSTVNGFVDPVTRGRGATALAPRLNIAAGTLSNKANPTQEHQLGLRESISLQLATVDFSILYAYNAALGHVGFRLPDADRFGDIELLDTYCELHARVGRLAVEIRNALLDQKISFEEVQAVRTAFDCLVRSGLGVVNRIEGLAR
jgi:hypothetical protein